ncbi:MAG: hypothetical protein QXM31_03895 [Candidatus Woesearchaeota archaeon]
MTNWKRVLTWIIAVVFLIALFFGVWQIVREKPSPPGLMMDAMSLRTTNDTVGMAEIITEMDRQIGMMKSPGISAQWASLSACIAANSCNQDDYFDFLLMVAVEKPKEVPHAEIIVNAITANRYWGNSEKIIEFSNALSEANRQVEELNLRTVRNKWQEIIQCDGKCSQFHELFFEFIRLLLSV